MSPKNTSFWLAFAVPVAPLDRAANFRAGKDTQEEEGRSNLGCQAITAINIKTNCFAQCDKIDMINGPVVFASNGPGGVVVPVPQCVH